MTFSILYTSTVDLGDNNKKMKYKVTYLLKSTDEKTCGLLTEKSEPFDNDVEAIEFIKQLRTRKDLLTSPLLEVLK